jgi:hypothetical protein
LHAARSLAAVAASEGPRRAQAGLSSALASEVVNGTHQKTTVS